MEELRELGADKPAEKLAGVTFKGTLELAYKACLWSRLANRILLPLATVPAATPEELYAGVQTIQWDDHIASSGTLHVNFVATHSTITHSLFGAQKVKDAIVDQLREKYGERPTVAKNHPDICVYVYLQRNNATISLDLSGESLHKRGYRLEHGEAPLKENLAAAILLRAGWKKLAAEKNISLVDPMCGSGTFLIEAALIAGNIAPGLLRDYFGFLGWKKHDPELWQQLIQEAEKQRLRGTLPNIRGYDQDPRAIKVAFSNIERAGMLGRIHVEKCALQDVTLPKPPGLLVVNPPYGERLGDEAELPQLYTLLGTRLKKDFVGGHAAVLTSHAELGKAMGLRSFKQYALFNGAIPCQLLLFHVQPEYFVDRSPEANNERRIRKAQKSLSERDQALAEMFANRIKKNSKHYQQWIKREQITSYRLYDADLPEYAVSVDCYHDRICVQEYPPPKSIAKEKADERLRHVFAVLPEALNVSAKQIFFRDRMTPLNAIDCLYPVSEQGETFLVNLQDATLTTGLPPEQRKLREFIRQRAKGKRFLSLFSPSGTMAVCAGSGGALTLRIITDHEIGQQWSMANIKANQLQGEVYCTDVVEWIQRDKSRYDLIFAELPDSTFRLLQHCPLLVQYLYNLLTPGGELCLVVRDPRFKLGQGNWTCQDLSAQLLVMDFQRKPNHQRVWLFF